MKPHPIGATALLLVLTAGLAACHPNQRQVTESTGSATATVKTTAPPNTVSNADLQQQAEHAADAASAPANVATSNGTGPANSTSP